MRKNKIMRLASALLVLTLLSTSIISGTFAKYTTTGTSKDTARVAKWGVEVKAESDSAFSATYAKTGTLKTTATIVNSVESANNGDNTYDNVVAPGTSGTLTKVSLSGTPEVAVRVSYTADLDLGDNWLATESDEVGASYYCPIVITVNGTEYKGTDYNSASEFETAVEDAINGNEETPDPGATKEYGPNEDLSKVGDDNLSVTWKWDFNGNDAKDTYLGNLTTAPEISLTVTTTVTQID